MSKNLQATIYVDERVSSIEDARELAKRAESMCEKLKGDLWGLIISTPKDVTPNGEEPIEFLKEKFEDIWDELWDSFVDDYKYTIIADDAEFDDDSLVRKCWKREKEEEEEYCKEAKKRNDFFIRYKDVLNPYNFDDNRIFDEFNEGKLTLTEPFTKEDRDAIIENINKRDRELINEMLRNLKDT